MAMKGMSGTLVLFLLVCLEQLRWPAAAASLPLSTHSRWIVDGEDRRVKLACVNWPSHTQALLAEGLSKQPVGVICDKILSMGFNCVRFTWPLYMVTDDDLARRTVRSNFQLLGLNESIAGLNVNNPKLLDLPIIDAFQAVVSSMAEKNIMVILDNHISKPGWCCGGMSRGNGFFRDKYFDPDQWTAGLAKMAKLFKGFDNVVGMSLRNELRGSRENVPDWFKYMTRGAEVVHAANPNVLVILSGLHFDNDLGFLHKADVNLTFHHKLVFEVHWYSFSNPNEWTTGNQNVVCGRIAGSFMRRAGFLVDRGHPLFVSEFGAMENGGNLADNRYISCALAVMADLDLDWALWALQGSYYFREGQFEMDESYGALDYNWCGQRNASYIHRIASLQPPFRGPGYAEDSPHRILFHPATGTCVVRKGRTRRLELGACNQSGAWEYTAQRTISLRADRNVELCLQAVGPGSPATVGSGLSCSTSNSKWGLISASKMHVSTKLAGDGREVCLDVAGNANANASGATVVTNPCKCLAGDNLCQADSQWFKLVSSTRSR